MTSLPDPSQAKPPLLLSGRNLSVVSLVLFTLFGTIVLGSTLPPDLASPLWQLRLSLALINAAPFPLAGLALLHLAAELDPEDPVLQRRHRLCAQLAVPAVLGLLLLLPLQTAAGLRQVQFTGNAQNARITKAERKLAALRQAVATATDNEQLNRQLQALQGPVLSPADLAQPLARLQSQVGAALDEGEAQIQRERLAVPSRSPLGFLPDLLRNSVACVAEAIGFAALAFRPGQEMPLLDEWRQLWFNRRQVGVVRRQRRSLLQAEADYFETISQAEPEPQQEPQEEPNR